MEKGKPHYLLNKVKDLVREGKWRPTRTAVQDAYTDFSFTIKDIENHVLNLKKNEFYKSMTTYRDHTLWQDVYRSDVNGVPAYVKVQIFDDMSVVISFKRRFR